MDITKNVCRACLTAQGTFQSIFVAESNCELSFHISEMISACTSIQVTPGDGLPDQICTQCSEETIKMYFFKLKCEKSDMILRTRLKEVLECYDQHFINEDRTETIEPSVKSEIRDYNPSDKNNALKELSMIAEKIDEDIKNNSETTLLKQDCVVEANVFDCDLCQDSFSQEDLLFRHKLDHSVKIEYEDSFEVNQNSSSPLMIKSEEYIFSCGECEFLFVKKEDLNNHIINDHRKIQIAESESESNVGSGFNRNLNLEDQKKTLNCEKPFICPVCGEGFASKKDRWAHKYRKHSRTKKFICNNCGKGFHCQRDLSHHLEKYKDEKTLFCSTCDKKFKSSRSLSNHRKTHSRNEKSHECEICSKKFWRSGNLRSHMTTHSDEKPYECDICKSKFSRPSVLARHKKSHIGERPYKCDLCESKFIRLEHLVTHKRSHTGEKPFECDICKRKFVDLGKHKKIHFANKPYECDVCKRMFSKSISLTIHKKIHTGEKTFVCEICSKEFTRSRGLIKHIKIHDRNEAVQV